MNKSEEITEALGEARTSPLMKFIQAHPDELDAKIRQLPAFKKAPSNAQVLNDITRWTWVFNSEELMKWVRSQGVKI